MKSFNNYWYRFINAENSISNKLSLSQSWRPIEIFYRRLFHIELMKSH